MVELKKVDTGCGLSELTGKSINTDFMLTLLKWLIPVDMTPEHKSEISPKFGRSPNAIFSQPFSCFNSNIAKSTQLSRGFIKVAKISQVRDTTKLCYVLYFHKAGTVKFSVALTVSR